ncbi:heparan-alpha-glucosaminide N-acetyltransferase [Reinekea marina]|uniref:Heparan-alpha-glucosaminide N-acetyltransferase n=1 Tax=Reinekea marina TaxID=1310421 RepID=A0ABV7WQZ2_9GAMM|nr:heparan-alpha-glucosaminide N-acetyltransferase [Reinekea marina]MDN3649377.1 heparan-alpha-glucosaminide N-acetyltransferase [Reinekea marina]
MNSSISSNNSIKRNLLIDQCRGLALILMAIFHFSYNLSLYGLVSFNSESGFFPIFRYLIVTLFFISVGYGLFAANHPSICWPAFWKRELKIVGGAGIISLVTWFMYPTSWVWFGVLHFIALASLLSLPLLRWPKAALVFGIATFILYNTTDWFNLQPLWEHLNEPLNLPKATQDLTRLVPWIGMIWIGIYVGYCRGFNLPHLKNPTLSKPLLFLSKHSLVFYLVHQGPLFILAWLIAQWV